LNHLEKKGYQMKAIVVSARSPIRLPSLRRSFLLIALSLLFVGFALCQMAQAVTPAPDGGYAGNNTAEGTSALFSLAGGVDNTGLGFQALYHNTTGNYNTAEGFRALFSNTTGAQNTASGVNALISNTTGNFNTADGVNTLFHNTIGALNTATGNNALISNTTGNFNTASGVHSLFHNIAGTFNTAIGFRALVNNTGGSGNIGIGADAGFNVDGSNNIDIGNMGLAGESGIIRIGTAGVHTDAFLPGKVGIGPYFAPAGEENLRIIRGVVSGAGNIIVGSGFTVSHGAPGSGLYTITFNTPFPSAPTVTATADTPVTTEGRIISTRGVTGNSAQLLTSVPAGVTDAAFHFIAVGPR
jgi:hypothetical protein